MRCRCVLLKSEGLSSAQVGEQTEMTSQSVNSWVKRFEIDGVKGLYTRSGQGRKPIMDCSDKAIESQTKRPFSQGSLAKLLWQGSEQFDIPTFFYPYWRKIQAYKKTSQECILAATLRIQNREAART